jgi:hypothetical protein
LPAEGSDWSDRSSLFYLVERCFVFTPARQVFSNSPAAVN